MEFRSALEGKILNLENSNKRSSNNAAASEEKYGNRTTTVDCVIQKWKLLNIFSIVALLLGRFGLALVVNAIDVLKFPE